MAMISLGPNSTILGLTDTCTSISSCERDSRDVERGCSSAVTTLNISTNTRYTPDHIVLEKKNKSCDLWRHLTKLHQGEEDRDREIWKEGIEGCLDKIYCYFPALKSYCRMVPFPEILILSFPRSRLFLFAAQFWERSQESVMSHCLITSHLLRVKCRRLQQPQWHVKPNTNTRQIRGN